MFQRSIQILYLWTALFASAGFSQQKHALLVGVGDHIYPSHALLGPKNDVPAFRNLLIEKYGFSPENIEVLQDADATRSNIISAFEQRLVTPVEEGDLALFYFTGHGTQVTDYSSDEPDGRDEAFVPYDGKTMSTLLIDDDLAKLINRIKTREVVVILDACHSGTGTRGLARPKRLTAKELGIEDVTEASNSTKTQSDAMAEELSNALVISAAREDQIAADYPFLWQQTQRGENSNPNMGALTYYLLKAAWNDRDDRLGYSALTELICAELGNNGFEQTPQFEGSTPNPFLTVSTVITSDSLSTSENPDSLTMLTPKVDAEVTGVREQDATLQSVSGMPLVRGSIFETVEQTIDNEPGTIRLTESTGQIAVGEVLSGQVETGDKLVETFHFVPQEKLRLAIIGDSTFAEQVKRELTTFEFLAIVNNNDFRDVEFEIHRNPDSLTITPYRNQQRLPDIVLNHIDSTAAKSRRLLENLYAVNSLTNLENPNPSFNVDVQVNGKDYDEIGIGSEVTFTVTVDHDAYVYLVDVDPAGKVTVLFPNVYINENFLKAGMEYKMPAPELYRLQVSGPAGPELIKAIATLKPLQLDILTADSSAFSGLEENAVDVAQSIADELKREVNRLSRRGIAVLPSTPVEQPISTEGWAADEVLVRVVE